jgi:PAS domain S-box-containing protein
MVVAFEARTERELVDGVGNNVLLGYWDANLRCRFANSTYEGWFGISPDKLIGSHITDHMSATFERNRARVEAALRGEPQRFECTIAGKNGAPSRHCLANYVPDVVDGKIRGFFVVTSDVSELKEAQLAFEASDAKFSRMIALAGDAIISIDKDRKVRIFNACAEEIYGYRAAEVIGRDVLMLSPERLRDVYAAGIAHFTTADESRVSAQTGIAKRKNGQELPVELTLSKFQLGDETQMTLLIRDITARERADLELRVLAETGAMVSASLHLDETLQAIANLIVTHLADSCAIDSLASDGKTIERLTSAHRDPEKAALVEEIAKLRTQPRNMVTRFVFDTGQAQILEDVDASYLRAHAESDEHAQALERLGARSTMIVPLKMQGTIFGALVLGSEKPHRYSEADLPLATELARRAALAIQNARLFEAEQRATRARDEILEVVAHDLRSPLNSILLGAQLLQYANIPDPVARAEVESIVRSTQWANRLIEDLLDVRRIEEGVLSIKPTLVSPRDAIAASVQMHSALETAAGISIRQEIVTDVQSVWADRDRLRQVLENLVGNAVKFTSPGGRVLISVVNDGPTFVRFSVSDTGTGIPEENLERVFDKFWQANRSERRGAGLGLPICKGIIEKHGGRIWGTSAVGQGATFHFTLPAAASK